MDVKTSKESFGQSAKILSALIDERFGKQGRGALASSREMLAKTLKFESAHAIELFFAQAPAMVAPEPAQTVLPTPSPATPRRFGDLPPDERAHAMRQILQSGADFGFSMWEERARVLLDALVELENSPEHIWHGSMGGENFLARMRSGLRLDALRDALRAAKRDHSSAHLARMLDGYLTGLPEFQIDAAKQVDATVAQHGFLSACIGKILDKAKRLEERGGTLLASPAAMDIVADYGINTTWFAGHWLSEERFSNVALKIAKRAQAAGKPQQPLDAWSFMLAALAAPVERERSSAMSCLLDIMELPASHCAQAYEDLAVETQTIPPKKRYDNPTGAAADPVVEALGAIEARIVAYELASTAVAGPGTLSNPAPSSTARAKKKATPKRP